MYCLFNKDHSSVYVQCAAANGATNPAGADVDYSCKRRHAQKYASLLSDIKQVNYMLYWVVSIFYIY